MKKSARRKFIYFLYQMMKVEFIEMKMKHIGTRKLTDRLLIALGFFVILIITLIIFHIILYVQMSNTLLEKSNYIQSEPNKKPHFKK